MILVIGIALMISIGGLSDPLDNLSDPEASVLRAVARSMEVAEARESAPRWMRSLTGLVFPDSVSETRQWGIEAIREVRERSDLSVELTASLAMLVESEDERESLLEELQLLDSSQVAAALEEPWFRRQLTGEPGDGPSRLRVVLGLSVYEGTVITIGLLALVLLVLGRVGIPRLADGITHDGWPPALGYAVMVRGVVFAVIGLVALTIVGEMLGSINAIPFPSLLASIPFLIMVRRWILAPAGRTLSSAFGLNVGLRKIPQLFGVSIALIGLDYVGAWLIARAGSALGFDGHWAEGFLEALVWDPVPLALSNALDGAIGAPFVEEIGCRGLLYVTLRSRLAPLPAALISAVLFSGVHLYSPVGFATLMWSGTIWALVYEKTRSLLPAMLGHAVWNGVALATMMLLLR